MRAPLTFLVALALLLRGLLPAGMMLLPSATSGETIVICTSAGLQTVTLDSEGKPLPANPAQGHTLCPCVCSSCPATAIPAGVALSIPAQEHRVDWPVKPEQVVPARIQCPAPARGPPLFA